MMEPSELRERTRGSVEKLSKGCQQLGIDVYKDQLNNKSNLNSCISPNSLMTVLSLLLAGARGETEKQIVKALNIDAMSKDDIHGGYKELLKSLGESGTTLIANALFIKSGFVPSEPFLNIARNNYNAETKNMDFEDDPAYCADYANNWVKKATRGKINEITNGFDSQTIMIIINAVYFKSAWKSQFRPFHTKAKKFFLDAQTSIYVRLMSQTGNFGYATNETANCQVLELLYKDQKASMVIFLPREIEGLPKLESALSPSFFEEVFGSLKEGEVKVTLPSFKLEFTYNLGQTLAQLGMTDMFVLNQANLRGINENSNLRVSEVIQKTFIEVNEEGTEAAAVSMMATDGAGRPTKCPEFKANHPFLYVIIDRKSRSILFMGSLSKPVEVTDAETKGIYY